MKALWTIGKVMLAVLVGIPLAMIAFGLLLGALGAVLGVLMLALRLAVIGVVVWLVYRLLSAMFGGARVPTTARVQALPPVDPYFEAAKRELDQELPEAR
jgi:hypothetical protein